LFRCKIKFNRNYFTLTGKSLTKKRKTVYGKNFRKPFSFQNTREALLCSLSLFSFSFSASSLCLCSLLSASALCPATSSHPSHPDKIWAGRLRVVSCKARCEIRLEDLGLGDLFTACFVQPDQPREAAVETRIYGFGIRGAKRGSVGLVGLRICGRRWVVVGLLFVGLLEGWICGFVFVVCLRICGWRWVVVGGGLLWLVEFVVGCGGLAVMVAISGDFGCGFCFILFYVAPNTQCKIFSGAFS
jgi:hypothetical protein